MQLQTWRFRLTPGYIRRRMGARIVLHAHNHLDMASRWPWRKFNDTPECQLLWDLWKAEGNFYRNHQEFPRWPGRVEATMGRVRRYFSDLWAALLARDLHKDCE